jgi:hypothetical protein
LYYLQKNLEESNERLMSDSECEFAEKHAAAWKRHMFINLTRHLPVPFQSIKEKNVSSNTSSSMINCPNVNRHVIFRALDDIDDIVDEDQGVSLNDIEKGSRWSCRYLIIRPYTIKHKLCV